MDNPKTARRCNAHQPGRHSIFWAMAGTVLLVGGVWAVGAMGQTAPATAPRPATVPPTATAPREMPAYKNTALSFEERARDLMSRMTLDQKAAEMQMMAMPLKDDRKQQQLDVPGINWWTEAIHGIGRAGKATQFPQAIGMAAAWDPQLMHDIGDAIGDEARVKYLPPGAPGADVNYGPGRKESGRYFGLTIWAPTINMARDPRWGRVQETYGEDPVLTSRLAVEFVKGLQGDDPKYLKTVATPKHFAMHSQETGRTSTSFDCSERTLREYYLPAFKACFDEGKAASVMAAHNGINGVPCTANKWLLTTVLRDEWGFQGAVVTDWNAVAYLVQGHHITNDEETAAALCIKAGVDVTCNEQTLLAPLIVQAVKDGQLSEKDVDVALLRSLLLRFRLGMFDPPEMVPFTKIPKSALGSPAHLELALKASRESIVLLQNNALPPGFGVEKVLPIDLRKVRSIAVVGPFADAINLGNYPGDPVQPITPLEGIKAAVGDRIRVETALWNGRLADPITPCVNAARNCDVAVVVVGLAADRADNTTAMEMEGVDRQTLEISPAHRQLIEQVVKANPVTVVVLEGGCDIGQEWLKKTVPATVMAWYPGEQGGRAIAEVLLGKVNPSGRLPITYYPGIIVKDAAGKDQVDLPALNDYEISKGRTYMYRTAPVSYPFGYGLSYTTFDYQNLKVEKGADGKTVNVSVDVANTGTRAGDEVVQVYIHKPDSAVSRPIKQLAGFLRVNVPAGETRTVKIPTRLSDVAYWDIKSHAFVIEPGKYEVMVGASSADMRVNGEFTLP